MKKSAGNQKKTKSHNEISIHDLNLLNVLNSKFSYMIYLLNFMSNTLLTTG